MKLPTSAIMEKMNKFFIMAFVAGLVAFSAALAIPTQMAQALIGTSQIENNAITSPKIKDGEVKTPDLATGAVTKEKLNPTAVNLVVRQRSSSFTVPAHDSEFGAAVCDPGEVITGGGYNMISAPPAFRVTQNLAGIDQHHWRLIVANDSDNPANVDVYAECAHLELGP